VRGIEREDREEPITHSNRLIEREIGGLGGKLGAGEKREEGAGREIGARDKGKRGKREGNRPGESGWERRERRELLSSFWRLLPLAQPSQRCRLATRLERLGVEAPPAPWDTWPPLKPWIEDWESNHLERAAGLLSPVGSDFKLSKGMAPTQVLYCCL
jgi:hypothetical protein